MFKLSSDKGINFNVIYTKCDKIKRVSEIEGIIKATKDTLLEYKFYSPFVIFTSSKYQAFIKQAGTWLDGIALLHDVLKTNSSRDKFPQQRNLTNY